MAKKRQNSRIQRRIFRAPGKTAAHEGAELSTLIKKYHFQWRVINFSIACNHENVFEN